MECTSQAAESKESTWYGPRGPLPRGKGGVKDWRAKTKNNPKCESKDPPGGSVAETPQSQFRGHRFQPWSGN